MKKFGNFVERERERESKSSRKQRRRRSRLVLLTLIGVNFSFDLFSNIFKGAVVDREIAEDDHDQETRNLDDQEVGTGDHDQESPTGEIEDQDPILMRNAEKSVKKKNVKTNRKLKKLQKKLVSRLHSKDLLYMIICVDSPTRILKVPEFLSGNAAVKRNYLETQAKRKLLWGGKKVAEKPTELTDQQKLWANLQVGTDKQTNKFQKVYIIDQWLSSLKPFIS